MRLRDFAGWFPIDVSWTETPPVVEWRHLGETPFEEPFFAQTVARALAASPDRAPIRTPINVLEEFGEESDGDGPTGFLFHMSRCGSTLATRLLSASARNLVLSEPDAINKVLGAPTNFPEPLRLRWLRGLIRALDQRRPRLQDSFFVKFSSWNVTAATFIKRAFPAVPCCFLYRDPVEVMVSLLDDPPGWLKATLDFEKARRASRNAPPGAPGTTPEEHCARTLAHFCRSALEIPGRDTLFLNYRDLPSGVWSVMASHFGISFTPRERERMGELAGVDAKDIHGVRKFEGDGAIKQRKASGVIREMAATWALEPFRELESRASR
jgi:hypothetical protein